MTAYRAWYDAGFHGDYFGADPEQFAVEYMNMAKEGSLWSKNLVITTLDPMPYTRFAKWVRDGYQIDRCINGLRVFDQQTKEFRRNGRNMFQEKRDNETREMLQDELRRPLPEL